QGQVLFQAGRRDDGLKLIADGLAEHDRVLAMQPKSFPARLGRVQSMVVYADLLRRAGRGAEAGKVVAAFASALDDLARDYPQMTWLKGTGAVAQSVWIIERVRAGTCPDPEAEFRPLLAAVPPQLQ